MAPNHSRKARLGAISVNDEPRDDRAGKQESPSNNSAGDRAQGRSRGQRGLNEGERRHLQTREKAEALAAQIRAHWLDLGVGANVFVEQVAFGRYAEFVVR